MQAYDIETNTWQTLPSLNIPRDNCNGVVIDGLFYVIGGRNSLSGQATLNSLEIYDPATLRWNHASPVTLA